jgi:hypothetical protein
VRVKSGLVARGTSTLLESPNVSPTADGRFLRKPLYDPLPDNFTGSATPSDWVIDLDVTPTSHPPDVQAYLYLIGAVHPTHKGHGWSDGIEAGLRRLRSAQAKGEGCVSDFAWGLHSRQPLP